MLFPRLFAWLNGFRRLPDYGKHMTIEEYKRTVEHRGFIDYDGFGKLATKTRMSDIVTTPSRVLLDDALEIPFPAWATHVVWFNK